MWLKIFSVDLKHQICLSHDNMHFGKVQTFYFGLYLLIDYVFLMRKLNKEHLASIHRWCVLLWVCVSVYGCVGVNFYKLGLLSQCMYVLNIPAWVCSKKGAEASINTLWSNFCCSMETIIIYSPSSEIVLFF